MPFEITVGPPQLVVHHAQAVFLSDPDGQVRGPGEKGLMFRDTRLISDWRVYANGHDWDLLNGGAITHYAARVLLTNRHIVAEDGIIPERTMTLVISRWISGGMHEDLDVTNYGRERVRFNLEVAMRSDFADLFEVKSGLLVRRGRTTTEWSESLQCLSTMYVNQDFSRGMNVSVHSEAQALYANGRLNFNITL